MNRSRLAIGVALAGCLMIQASFAEAGMGNCAKVILKFVGQPLAEAAVKKGSEIMVEYFADQLTADRSRSRASSGTGQLTERDLTNLRAIYEQHGRSECELRHDLERVVDFNPAPVPVMRGSICVTMMGVCAAQVPAGSGCGCYDRWGQALFGIAE
jgi:hypothetical protein